MYVEDIALAIQTKLHDRYILDEVYYIGHTSIVYLSRDIVTNVKVIVKEYCPHRLANRDMDGKSVVGRNDAKEQFRSAYQAFEQEIEIVKKIKIQKKPYENCVLQYIDSFYENETLYLVTEYVEGKSLEDYINQGQNYSIRECMLSLVRIVEQIHKMGILHRDIKPSNIIIRPDGLLTLIDFGSSCFIKDTGNKPQFVSRGYSAPELYNGEPSTRQTDIYSIGALLYYILTDYQIPPANEMEEGEKIPTISEFHKVPKRLEKAVMKAIEASPEKRTKHLYQLKILLMT